MLGDALRIPSILICWPVQSVGWCIVLVSAEQATLGLLFAAAEANVDTINVRQ